MKNRKIKTSIAAGALVVTSIVGLGATAFAANGQDSGPKSGKAPTAAQIAEHEAKRKANMEDRLTQAVKDGKITEDQKSKIISFFEENKPTFDANATHAEREAAMDAFKEKVYAFASENNIDLDLLRPAGGPGGHGGPGGENRTPPSAQERKAHQEEQLTQAVADGKITESQKNLIQDFFNKNAPSEPKANATPEEHKATMDAFKEKVDAFAEKNNIDLDVLKPAGGPGGPGGHGGPGGPGGMGDRGGSGN